MSPGDIAAKANDAFDTGFTSGSIPALDTYLSGPKQTLQSIQDAIDAYVKECVQACQGDLKKCTQCVNDYILLAIGQGAQTLKDVCESLDACVVTLIGTAYGYASSLGITVPPLWQIEPQQVLSTVFPSAKSPATTQPPTGYSTPPSTQYPQTPPSGYYAQPPLSPGAGLPPSTVPPSVQTGQTSPPGTVTPPYTPPTIPGTMLQPPTIPGTFTPPLPGTGIPPVVSPAPVSTVPGTVSFPPVISPATIYNLPPTQQQPIGQPPVNVTCPPSQVACPPPVVNMQCPAPNVTINVTPGNVSLSAEVSGQSISNAAANAFAKAIGGTDNTPPPIKPEPLKTDGECPDDNDVEWLWRECSTEYEQEVATFAGDAGLAYFDASRQEEVVAKFPTTTIPIPEVEQLALDAQSLAALGMGS